MFPLSLFNFIYYASMAMVAPFLPLYFYSKGLTTTEIGLVLAIGPLVSIFAQPFWCYISDQKKTIKRVLLVILLLTLLNSSLLFMVNSFYLILLFMLAFMFVMTPIQPLSDSLLIGYTERHQKNYGSIRLWGCVGFALSAVIIGTIIEKMGIGYLGILYEILVLLIMMAIIPLQDSTSGQTQVSVLALKQLFKNRQLIWFLFLLLMISVPSRMNESIFGLFMSGLGATKTQIGSAWTIVALSEVPLFLLMTSILRRYHELRLIALAALIYSIRWFLTSLVNDPTVLMALQLIQSITFPLLFTSCLFYVKKIVPKEMLATGQAAFAAVFSGLAGVIGNLLGGSIMDSFGAYMVYRMGSILTLAGAGLTIITYFYLRRNYKYKARIMYIEKGE